MMDGARIRQATLADAEEIAQVHVTSWQSAYRGIVDQEYLDTMSVAERAERWRRALDAGSQTRVYVAVDAEGRIAGFVSGGPPRECEPQWEAELYALYVLPECHGRGIGRALTVALAAALQETGCRNLIVWALRDNPACGFYERLGAHVVARDHHEIGGKPYASVAYGWRAIDRVA